MKICFLGCGNIAQAIIDGLLKSGMQPSNIACIERNEQRVKSLKSQNLQIIELENLASIDFDLIVLAVKPKDALSAAQSILKHAPTAIILSVVAGIGIEKYSQPKSIIRVMPNTACAFGKGVTAIYALDQSSVAFSSANSLFRKVGHVLTLQNEDEMHRFTSIIGSGQAFLFQVLNTYLKELEQISSTDQVAAKSMFQDFVSSLGDSFSQNPSFESLINKIKSPGGTTQAGLESLEKNNLDKILQDAFKAAENRSIEISNE
ncbi:pyrroline-5-carboxylate reductase dimerization domain-containing protein [Gammaproteobacteria bacterium]|nr:pyrroline-5-carboxylate reductase dimerization domain-containing protein [Gammaproteobacteria bacterium]